MCKILYHYKTAECIQDLLLQFWFFQLLLISYKLREGEIDDSVIVGVISLKMSFASEYKN